MIIIEIVNITLCITKSQGNLIKHAWEFSMVVKWIVYVPLIVRTEAIVQVRSPDFKWAAPEAVCYFSVYTCIYNPECLLYFQYVNFLFDT